MTTEAQWWVRRNESASEKGPFAGQAVMAAVANGDMSLTTLVRREGSDEWLPLRDQPALRPVIPAPSEASKAASAAVEQLSAKRFSVGTMIMHVVVVTVAFFALGMVALMASDASSSAAYALGQLYGKALPLVLLGSYFYQKR